MNLIYSQFTQLSAHDERLIDQFVLICSGLNFQDLMVRQGAIDSPPKCPFILGFECAGEIEQLGEGVEGFVVSIFSIIIIWFTC